MVNTRTDELRQSRSRIRNLGREKGELSSKVETLAADAQREKSEVGTWKLEFLEFFT